MVYDPATGQLVLFGGEGYGGDYLGDTWTWNGTTWTQQYPTTSPPARDGASMDYDPGTGQLVLFGGDDASGGNLNDTWVYSPIDTVAFNSDGGAAVPSISGPDGSSITLPSDTYPSYVFNGWYTAASGGTKVGAAGVVLHRPSGRHHALRPVDCAHSKSLGREPEHRTDERGHRHHYHRDRLRHGRQGGHRPGQRHHRRHRGDQRQGRLADRNHGGDWRGGQGRCIQSVRDHDGGHRAR